MCQYAIFHREIVFPLYHNVPKTFSNRLIKASALFACAILGEKTILVTALVSLTWQEAERVYKMRNLILA